MMTQLHEQIRRTLEEKPGLTQKGLAECMGLNPAAVNRMLYGRRNIMASEIPVIENYLGVKLDLADEAPRPAPVAANGDSKGGASFMQRPSVPVYGCSAGKLDWEKPVDWAPCHPLQEGIPEAFAIYVFGQDMAPRYFQGELAYLHPGKPVEAGRDCLVVLQKGNALLRRVLALDEKTLTVQQYSPEAKQKIARKDIAALYAVISRG